MESFEGTIDPAALAKVHGMVNLAGAGVMDHRWTDAYKKEIISSRTDTTDFLIDALQKGAPLCTTYISAAATGIYGPDRPGHPVFTETDAPYPDFLGSVCKSWEAAAAKAEGTYRTVILRFGIVLGKDGGAYQQFAAPLRFGVMPVLGSGLQQVSWIHIDDVARMVLFALEGETVAGTYNCVAPNAVSHLALMKAIAAAQGGVSIPVSVPAFALKILLGESSIEVLKSCTVSPEKILKAGFLFSYQTIDAAAKALAAH